MEGGRGDLSGWRSWRRRSWSRRRRRRSVGPSEAAQLPTAASAPGEARQHGQIHFTCDASLGDDHHDASLQDQHHDDDHDDDRDDDHDDDHDDCDEDCDDDEHVLKEGRWRMEMEDCSWCNYSNNHDPLLEIHTKLIQLSSKLPKI